MIYTNKQIEYQKMIHCLQTLSAGTARSFSYFSCSFFNPIILCPLLESSNIISLPFSGRRLSWMKLKFTKKILLPILKLLLSNFQYYPLLLPNKINFFKKQECKSTYLSPNIASSFLIRIALSYSFLQE